VLPTSKTSFSSSTLPLNRNEYIVRTISSWVTVTMSASTEARELELVGKVEMKIALAKDDKLESILKPYLPALLLKLASKYPAVRNKVRTTNTDT
jgi:hypothetical protein